MMASTSSEDSAEMSKCARCGDPTTGEEHYISRYSQSYDYCEDCCETFEEVKENGVKVRSRHGNRIDNPRRDLWADAPYIDGRPPRNQVEALAAAVREMEEHDVRGIFIYQKTGSRWLISEYLDAHPSIAADVEEYLESQQGGLLSRILPF